MEISTLNPFRMAERIDDVDDQSTDQRSTSRLDLVIPVMHVVCQAWMAWVSLVPIVRQIYITYKRML